MHKRPLSASTTSDTKSGTKSDTEPESERGHAYKDDKNVPYQPPHPQHTPSSLEIAQANARIADQKVKLTELNIKLAELDAKFTRDKLLLTRQRDAATQAVRNERSFIAGKCYPRNVVERGTHVPFQ